MALSNVRTTARPVAIPLTSVSALVGADLDFDPRDCGRLGLWLPNVIPGITSGAALSRWPDKSGNNVNITQSSGTKQPIYTQGKVNGKPTLVFDGTNDGMANGDDFDLIIPRELTIAAVVSLQNASVAAKKVIVAKAASSTNDGWSLYINETGNGNLMSWRANNSGAQWAIGQIAVTSNYGIYIAAAQSGMELIYANGTLSSFATVAALAADVATNLSIGSSNGGNGEPCSSNIPELLIYRKALLHSEHRRLERRAHRLYGIAIAA